MDQIALGEDLKVFEQRELCVQEESPLCQSACPLGVNTRSMLGKASQGKLEAAFSEYRKQVIFAEILSRICDAPCKGACALGGEGEPVEIALIERACAEHGENKPAGNVFIRPRGLGAVVVGAGLSGLACAYVLSRKGYDVDIYDDHERPGGSLRGRCELGDDIIDAELSGALQSSFIKTHFGERVTGLSFGEGVPVLVATGAGGETFGIDAANVDASVMRDNESGVFFAGGVAGFSSPAEKIASGKRAAVQIEHVLKGEPVTRFSLGERTVLPPPEIPETDLSAVRPENGRSYSRQEAVREAARCLQCECRRCIRGCLLLQSGGLYPKYYIDHASQSLKTLKLMQNKLAARRTNACNLCGLCRELCPSGVDMEEVYMKSRRIMHMGKELPEAFHSFWLRDMEFSRNEAYLCRPEPGYEKVEYLFFPGCQLGGSGPEYVTDSYAYLRGRLPGGVGLCVGCCGAPAEWSGRAGLTREVTARFREEWENLGKPVVILACPTCEKIFSRYHADITARPLLDVFREYGAPETAIRGEGMNVNVFDPCSSRNNPGEQKAVRELILGMGYKITELEFSGRLAQCCGYGGLIYASNPELKDEIVRNRVGAGELPYITYCANCREELSGGGKGAAHILDLLFGRAGFDRGQVTLSERRERRLRLKALLMKEIWGEAQADAREDMELVVSSELAAKLDRELILTSDVRAVISNSVETGERVLTREGSVICHLFVDPITYWVEYRERGGAYELVNAYTHRMRIQERGRDDG